MQAISPGQTLKVEFMKKQKNKKQKQKQNKKLEK